MTTPGTTERAAQVKDTVGEQTGQVAQTAKEQAQNVASEAAAQARDLAGEARTQVRQQTDQQRERLAGTLHQLGDELRSMAENGEGNGVVTEVARQGADRVHGIASYVEQNQPGDLLNEVRAFARRRPGTFLLGAAAAGVVAGRLTRGIKAGTGPSTGGTTSQFSDGAYTTGSGYTPTSAYAATPPPRTPVPGGATGPATSPAVTGAGVGTGPVYDEVEVVAVEVEPVDPLNPRRDLP